jgi:hypothetical protein
MPAQQPDVGGVSRGKPTPRAREVVAQLQELVDTRPAQAGYPLDWAVRAYFLGDVNALASLSLRSAA